FQRDLSLDGDSLSRGRVPQRSFAARVMANFGFIPVSLSTLYPTDGLGLDLYIRPQGYERPVLFCASTLPLHLGDLSRLEESGITKLYIRREARQQYQEYVRGHLET